MLSTSHFELDPCFIRSLGGNVVIGDRFYRWTLFLLENDYSNFGSSKNDHAVESMLYITVNGLELEVEGK
jgi:hypothetical protein